MIYTISSADDIRLGVTDTVQSVLQSVACIMQTRKGSVPNYRDYGMSQTFIDAPTQIAKVRFLAELKEVVEKYEPRAIIKSVSYTKTESGVLNPIVEVEINE